MSLNIDLMSRAPWNVTHTAMMPYAVMVAMKTAFQNGIQNIAQILSAAIRR
jgi:hypothetical protein